jgi:hypothetical protein
MTKLTLLCVLIAVGAASMTNLSVTAARPDDDAVMSIKGTVNWAWATKPSGTIQVVNPNPDRCSVIFSNLGPKDHLYEGNVAWDVAGPDSGVQQQWVAMPFTPAFNAEVTRVAIAVEHNSGSPNSFVLSLNADNGIETPGKALHGWSVKQAPKFGTCCTIDVARDEKGLRVHKGIQYWIVVRTNAGEDDTRMECDLSPVGIEGNFAFNNGQGWYEYTAFTAAFAVYGKKMN